MTPKIIRAGVLRPSARTQLAYSAGLRELIDQMTKEVKAEVLALFRSPVADVLDHDDTNVYMRTAREMGLWQESEVVAFAMDASLADSANKLMDRMLTRFSLMFDRSASSLSTIMVNNTLRNSEQSLQISLRDSAKDLTLEMTPQVANMIDASAAESAALIKRVPQQYIPQIQGDVMRSITTGNGLADLIPALEAQNVKVKNWAANVARDQTRKAYNNINKARMLDNGVEEYEWIHSGGGNKPREYHLHRWPSGLNGGIFRFDDPPIIDQRTGERGIPGQLPYCGCTMRPIIRLDKDQDNADQ